jgi:hypothetical protein
MRSWGTSERDRPPAPAGASEGAWSVRPGRRNVSRTIAGGNEVAWTQTLEATLRRKARTWTVAASAPEPLDAYDRLEREALADKH